MFFAITRFPFFQQGARDRSVPVGGGCCAPRYVESPPSPVDSRHLPFPEYRNRGDYNPPAYFQADPDRPKTSHLSGVDDGPMRSRGASTSSTLSACWPFTKCFGGPAAMCAACGGKSNKKCGACGECASCQSCHS
eukprot:Selendium_serpulae@DN10400_c0_g1_i1.p1